MVVGCGMSSDSSLMRGDEGVEGDIDRTTWGIEGNKRNEVLVLPVKNAIKARDTTRPAYRS
jgi:hypothetical protein